MLEDLAEFREKGNTLLCLKCVQYPCMCALLRIEERLEGRMRKEIRNRTRSVSKIITNQAQENWKETSEAANLEGNTNDQASITLKKLRLHHMPLAHQGVGGASNQPPNPNKWVVIVSLVQIINNCEPNLQMVVWANNFTTTLVGWRCSC